MIELVNYFNGEERRIVGTGTTHAEIIALLPHAAWGDGWGYRVRGTMAELEAIGAYKTTYGAWVLPHNGSFIDCSMRHEALRKKLIFSGRTKPPTVNKDGSHNLALCARVWSDASVTVASNKFAPQCDPTPQERIEALEAAVKFMAESAEDLDAEENDAV